MPKTINDAQLHFKTAIACRNMWFVDRDVKKCRLFGLDHARKQMDKDHAQPPPKRSWSKSGVARIERVVPFLANSLLSGIYARTSRERAPSPP